MNETFRLGRIAGIPVGFHWSLLVVFWLITWSLAAVQFPETHPGHGPAAYWLAAVVTAVVFYACLLAHEMGHALLGRRMGTQIDGITLWLFGGVARMRGEAATARTELAVGVVGPAVSVAAAAVFGVTRFILDGLGAPELVVAVAAWLAWINLLLAAFNMVPAYPLDGGRVLRALLWARHGDRLKATATAARAGKTFAYTLIGFGLLSIASGGIAGGVWFIFLGWFLLGAATAEATGALTRDMLGDIRVRELMSPHPVVVPVAATVEEVLEHYAMRHRCSAFPLVDDGEVVGLVTLQRLKTVPFPRRRITPAASVAWPLSDVPIASPADHVVDLLERMGQTADGRALVMEEGRLVGIVSPTDVARLIELATARYSAEERRPAA